MEICRNARASRALPNKRSQAEGLRLAAIAADASLRIGLFFTLSPTVRSENMSDVRGQKPCDARMRVPSASDGDRTLDPAVMMDLERARYLNQ